MPPRKLSVLSVVAVMLGGCAARGEPGAPAEAPVAEAAPRASVEPARQVEPAASSSADEPLEAEPPAAPALPSECAAGTDPCAPPGEFVDRLCRGKHLGVALVMFEKSAPWKHMYVKVPDGVDASNTVGGPTGDTRLAFAEEVLVLRHFGGGSEGVQVSGSGGYHVLRWDGTCATLSEHELVTHQPGVVRHAAFVWKYLDPPIQEALLGDAKVAKARQGHRERCRGASAAHADQPCQKASKELQKAIVTAIRRGLELPLPGKLP